MWPMSIGTGIFLGSLALALVVLFLGTKDRWRWRRIIFFTTATVVVVGLGLAGAISYFGGPLEGPLDSIWGIRLGVNKADMLFGKGQPARGTQEDDVWMYLRAAGSQEGIISVFFDADGEVGRISYWSKFGGFGEPQLATVGIAAPLTELTTSFGEPQRTDERPDSLERIFVYSEPPVFFKVARGRVESFGIYDPAFGPETYDRSPASLALFGPLAAAANDEGTTVAETAPELSARAAADEAATGPQPASELLGVSLRASRDDLLFVKGRPRNDPDEDHWEYFGGLNAWFIDGTVAQVTVTRVNTNDVELLGIHFNDSSEMLIEQLGEPSEVRATDGGIQRWYFYPPLRVAFGLRQNTVIFAGIFDPERVDADSFVSRFSF